MSTRPFFFSADDDILGQVVSSDFQEDNERFTLMGFKGEAALSSDDHASLSDTFSLYVCIYIYIVLVNDKESIITLPYLVWEVF